MNKNTKIKLIISAVIGNTLEYIDFMIFIFLAPIIANLFFPRQPLTLALTYAYLTILITYFFRPIGGVIFGSIGDRYGRKSVFSFTLLLMAFPSLIIGLMPTYKDIGYAAPVILIAMRVLQGCSMGGEVPGAVTYIVEKFKQENYFFYCALLTCGANIGISIGSQTINLLTQYTSNSFMYNIGWRIFFISGGLLAIMGFYIRIFLTESEEFLKLQINKQTATTPFKILIREFSPEITGGVLLCMVVSLITSVFHIFLPSLLVTHYSFSLSVATNMSSIGAVTMAIFSLYFAYLTKSIYPIKIVHISIIGLIILFTITITFGENMNQERQNLVHIYGVILVTSVLMAGINGIFLGLLANMFPVNVRYSGVSTCYNLAYILGAGLTPLWANSLLLASEKSYKYIIALCLIFLLFFISLFKPKPSMDLNY
jgi:MFS family permease